MNWFAPKRFDKGDRIEMNADFSTHDKIIFDPEGTPLLSYEDLRQALPHGSTSESGLTHYVSLPNHTIGLNGHRFPIDGINMSYDVNVTTETRTIVGR